ncbi:ABC transporter substrate-binding protein [Inconstantimicrobium mannanitabidum]|uniref:Sugar ABC transporter substrate-binding protein n=1 Tax=Inconstantimicrobium mannanitabidum TaxID=1604901 RepID=A0ACB5R787_9CLOT|nr:extracellular solute-binding protein [Clostridium sp. TW13]GKX65052.1 sugar ABC transporter substrate-binding protein [Clostridium sp. TW13]
MRGFIKNKKVIVITLIIAVILGLGFYPIINKKIKGYNSNNVSSNTLKIYMYNNDPYLRTAIDEFKSKYPNIRVDEVNFTDLQQYKEKLSTQVMGGEGPDVVLFDDYIIDSISKVLKNGVFEDMNPFIQKDKTFKKEDYNAQIMKCGVYKDKLNFVPVSYKVPLFISTQEILKNNSIRCENGYTTKQFMDNILQHASSINGKEEKYIFSDSIPLSDFIISSGLNFVDYENKKTNFNNEDVAKMINTYKVLSKYFADDKIKQKYVDGVYGMIKDGSTIFLNDNMLEEPVNVMETYSVIKQAMNQEEVMCPFPTYNGGGKITAIADECMAINKNSKNKEMAYNFIKCAISEKVQASKCMRYIPVNNNAVKDILDECKEKFEGQETEINNQKVIMHLPKNLENNYKSLISNINRCEFIDLEIEALTERALDGYFKDKSSYENSIKEAEEKVKLYLNE